MSEFEGVTKGPSTVIGFMISGPLPSRLHPIQRRKAKKVFGKFHHINAMKDIDKAVKEGE
jgi:hypothetical protein